MILYFTGTGNSRRVALVLAREIGDQAVDIAPLIKKGEKGVFSSERPYVIVAPTHAYYIPHVVEDFFNEATLQGNSKVYFLLSCGSTCSKPGVVRKLRPLCLKKGMELMGVEQIVMPENYITLFSAPSESDAIKIIEGGEKKVRELAPKIGSGEKIYLKSHPTFLTNVVNPLFCKNKLTDKPYYTTDACIGCGKCAAVCPVNDIVMQEKKPVWQGKCIQCMACISQCPTQAIEYGKRAQGKRRYYLP